MFGLRSPKTGEVVREVDARTLWQKILEIRLQTGEPYLIFSDTVNRAMPQHQRELGLKVRQSNLCSEIMLHTGKDHLGEERTAVCCLSSVNAETFLEWRDHPTFIEDVHALPRQRAAGLHRPRAAGDGRRPSTPPCASARWAWA